MNDFVIENGVLKRYKGAGGEITIPEGVTEIGDGAFSFQLGLTGIKVPESVTGIGSTAFFACKNLKSVTLPKHLTCIGDSAFSFCDGLTEIELPEGVTAIGERTFFGCGDIVINAPQIPLTDRLPAHTGLALVRGFALAVMQGRRISPERKEEYLAYLRNNTHGCRSCSAKDGNVRRLMKIENIE